MVANSLITTQKSRKNNPKKPYFKMNPEAILEHVLETDSQDRLAEIKKMQLICCPHVYPSDKFRTTNFLLEAIQPFLKNSRVCDMGCGPGIIGLYAILQGAKKVVQADINPFAVQNAEKNKKNHAIEPSKMEIYLSDCFDNIPLQNFDNIIFNLPFHSDVIQINEPLAYAFFDPSFQTVRKFLNQVTNYCVKNKTNIFLAFSNKGDIKTLEDIFEDSVFNWKLWKVINQDQEYDNRIYLLMKF
jgi:16S rRNA G1207 methylase RsmC